MADFKFQLEDLLHFGDEEGLPQGALDAITREQGKFIPGDLTTTQSLGVEPSQQFSTLSISRILQGEGQIKSTEVGLRENDYLTSALVAGAKSSDDNEDGSFGIFDEILPKDLDKAFDIKEKTATSDGGTADGGSGGTVIKTDGSIFMVDRLLKHPNWKWDRCPARERATQDLKDGLINPWLVATLNILCDNFTIYFGNFDVHSSRYSGGGHMANSQHYIGNAVDISAVAPKNKPTQIDEVETDTPIVQSVLNCINSIHAPWRPSTVICCAFASFGGGGKVIVEGTVFTANADHGLGAAGNGHFHIDCKVRPKPEDVPPPPKPKDPPVPDLSQGDLGLL